MLGRLSTLFYSSEDQFSRTQQQFIDLWNNVVECLTSSTVSTFEDVRDCKVSFYMSEMMHMVECDKVPEDSDYGPCVEYILQNEVLSTLQLHAQNDIPTGMRPIVLSFFSQLLQKLDRSVLPHLKVHKPLQDMICVCGGGKYAIDEINFIASLLSKFHEDPSLVNLFMNENPIKRTAIHYEMRLVDALISLSHNKEEKLAKKSCQAMLLCVTVDSEYLIHNIITYTILIQDLVSRLCQRYNSFQSDPDDLLDCHVSWTSHTQPGTRGTATLLLITWVDYLNTLATSSHPYFTSKLLGHLAKVFLHTHVLNDFNSSQPLEVIKALTMCRRMVEVSTSELLLVEVLKFLTEESVMSVICSLLNNQETRVQESALTLLYELLATRHSLVVQTLVLQHTKRHRAVRGRLPSVVRRAANEGQTANGTQRKSSSDSGVEEMYSDEETSYIHMDTSQLAPEDATPNQACSSTADSLPSNKETTIHNCQVNSKEDVVSSTVRQRESFSHQRKDRTNPFKSEQFETVDPPSNELDISFSKPDQSVHQRDKSLNEQEILSNGQKQSSRENEKSSSENEKSLNENDKSLNENDKSSDKSDKSPGVLGKSPNDHDRILNDQTTSQNTSSHNTFHNNDTSHNSDTSRNTLFSDSSSLTSLLDRLNLYEVSSTVSSRSESPCSYINRVQSEILGARNGDQLVGDQDTGNSEDSSQDVGSQDVVSQSVGSQEHQGGVRTVVVSHDVMEDVRRCQQNDRISLKLDTSVSRFLDIMPELNKPRILGFSDYLHDAHLKASESEYHYGWMYSQHTSREVAGETSSELGVFLDKVLSMILSIPYQGYNLNLLLISLISEIAHIPHDSVTVILLDTTLHDNILYHNLVDIAEQFKEIFQVSPTMKEQLYLVSESEMPDVCRAAYLTEEFCKELSAISLVKSISQ